jgi:hypothetical protein
LGGNEEVREEQMDFQPFLIELLVSGFFAIACLRGRAGEFTKSALSPRDFFRMLPRLERLRRTRWQWFAMVLLLFVIRKQIGVPMVVELTALAQFLIFLMLPVAHECKQPVRSDRVTGGRSERGIQARAAAR